MIKFEICSVTVLLYEVPTIDVPSLKDESKVSKREIQDIKEKVKEENIEKHV